MAKIIASPIQKITLTPLQKKVVAYLHYRKSAAILYDIVLEDYRVSFLGKRRPISVEQVTIDSLLKKGIISLTKTTDRYKVYNLVSDLEVKV